MFIPHSEHAKNFTWFLSDKSKYSARLAQRPTLPPLQQPFINIVQWHLRRRDAKIQNINHRAQYQTDHPLQHDLVLHNDPSRPVPCREGEVQAERHLHEVVEGAMGTVDDGASREARVAALQEAGAGTEGGNGTVAGVGAIIAVPVEVGAEAQALEAQRYVCQE